MSPRLAKQEMELCQSLWSLYKVSVTKTLCGDRNTIQMTKFLALHDSIGLPDILKQYIIVTHVPEYFRHHNVTLRASSEEYLESTHSALRNIEEQFSARTKGRKRRTTIHQERLLRSSSYLFNFPCLGFLPREFEEENVPLPQPPPPHHLDHAYCQKVWVPL